VSLFKELPYTLRHSPHGEKIIAVLEAALQAVEPGAAITRYVKRRGQRLEVGRHDYDLEQFERIYMIGAGKAGAPMAGALARILGDRLSAGTVIVKDGHSASTERSLPPTIQLLEAAHPLPDERGVQATQQIIELLAKAGLRDLVFCLISGGGSALLTAPEPGISLADLQNLTSLLLANGATITEINTLRKHLDRVKGGRLARLAQPAQLVTLVLSDVVGSPLQVIASGPCVPDPSTFQDAWQILARYNLLDQTPAPVVQHLEYGLHGYIPETPKPDDELFDRVHNLLVAGNLQAAEAACQKALTLGFNPLLLTTYLEGEARQAGGFMASIARQAAESDYPARRPACIVAGGETTVTVRGSGKGGRNLEAALGALVGMAGLKDALLITLATDGADGPTDAAGAVISGQSLGRALQQGMSPEDYLTRNDSYTFFARLEDLLITGPTFTNVNDLAFIFTY